MSDVTVATTSVTLTGTGTPHPAPGRAAIAGTPLERIVAYHADTVALGGLAARAGVGHLVLTHLIPAPSSPEHEAAFERDIRSGGYDGPVTVGRDLITITV